MENKTIPKATKKYVAKRSTKLLAKDTAMLAKVKLCDKIYISGKATKKNKAKYAAIKKKTKASEYRNVTDALSSSNIQKLKKYNGTVSDPATIDWTELGKEATTYEQKNMILFPLLS